VTQIAKIRAALLAKSDETEKFREALAALAELETELADAVAQRDEARRSAQSSAEAVAHIETVDRNCLREVARMLIEQIGASGPEFALDTAKRACRVIETLRARLAAIDAQPTAAIVDKAGPMLDVVWRDPEQALTLPHGTELIARPEAK